MRNKNKLRWFAVLIAILGFAVAACEGETDDNNDIAVTLSEITANGSTAETTTQLTLIFNQESNNLDADDIILSGVRCKQGNSQQFRDNIHIANQRLYSQRNFDSDSF